MLRKLLNWGCDPLISSWQDQRHNHPPMCQTEAGTPEVGISSAVFGVTLLVQQRRALKRIEQREVRSLLREPSSPVQEPASESALSSTRWRFCAPSWPSQLKPDVRAEENAGTVQTSEVTMPGCSLPLRPGFSCFSEGDSSLASQGKGVCVVCSHHYHAACASCGWHPGLPCADSRVACAAVRSAANSAPQLML